MTDIPTKKNHSLHKLVYALSHKLDKQEKMHQEVLELLKSQNTKINDMKQSIMKLTKTPMSMKQNEGRPVRNKTDMSLPMMLISQMMQNKPQETNTFDEIILPDTKRDVFKKPDRTQYDNFVELKFNSLDDICVMGQLFTDMHENSPNILENKENKETKTTSNLTEKENNIINTAFDMLSFGGQLGMSDVKIFPLLDDKPFKTLKPLAQNNDKILPDSDNLYLFKDKRYSVNPHKLMNLVKPIQLLNSMVAMNDIKKSIFNFISNFLHKTHNNGMLNTAIYGKPGIGKTDLGKILCMIYSALGLVQSNKFKMVKASDLIGQFVGHTRQKTKEVLDESNGGVLFIDEAYALTNNSPDRVSFGKECIDTINQELSENRRNLVIIIAGYEREIQEGFFNVNQGLERRFPFRYVLKDYNKEDMKNIFLRMLRLNKEVYLYSDAEDEKENVSPEDILSIFNDMKYFDNCGGDIENLITQISIANSTRTFGKHPGMKNIYTKTDIKTGFETFKKNKLNVSNDEFWNSVYI